MSRHYWRPSPAEAGRYIDDGLCGLGNTAFEMTPGTYRLFVGVDISEVALRKARERMRMGGRAEGATFINADFLSSAPARRFDVILWRESLYHVSLGQLGPMFKRYAQYLSDRGTFAARLRTRVPATQTIR